VACVVDLTREDPGMAGDSLPTKAGLQIEGVLAYWRILRS
jgi:hypothetical protein